MNPNLKVYSTDVLIEEELPDLKPGASARAEIIVTNLMNALTVPLQSVTTVKGKQVCYVQNGDGIAPVPVSVGNFNDQFIEIRAGLKEGDLVALTPPAPTNDELEPGGSERFPAVPPSPDPAPAKVSATTRNETQARPESGAALPATAKRNSTDPSRL
jgi:HlyD family secretion protein